MNLSIVIPNYNGEEVLAKNLPKVIEEIQKYKKGNTEIIVVDDGSEDKSVEIIKKFPDVKLFINKTNMGFSHTVNKGVGHASGEILILLNTDVYPDKDFLDFLLPHFKDENLFAVGCMDKSVEGENVVLRGRGTGSWQRGFLIHAKGEVDKTDTLWVSGGSGAFRKSIWESLNGLNNLYNPFYWEDIDLSYRAQKMGYKVIFEPKSTVWHEHEKGVIKKKFSAFNVRVIVYRNQFVFVWTNVTDADLILKHILWLPYHFIKGILNIDTAFFLGFFKAIIMFPKILRSRLRNTKLFVRSDYNVTKMYKK